MSQAVFVKLGNSVVQSWHLSPYKGRNIFPDAVDQGPYPTCAFHAHTKGGQMSVHKAFADVNKDCDIVMYADSMIKDFLSLNNLQSQYIWLVNSKADSLDRAFTASWILTRVGVEARSYCWDGPRLIAVSDVEYLGVDLSFQALVKMLEKGEPVLAIMIAGPDFEQLGPGEIYTCSREPQFDKKMNLLPPHEYHMVVLVGHGESEMDMRQIVSFLNSHSKEFGEDGSGWLYFDEVEFFFRVDSSYPPIIKPYPSRKTPVKTDRQYINWPKWRPKEKSGISSTKWCPKEKLGVSTTIQKHSEGSGRADASTWRSRKHWEAANDKQDTDSYAILINAILAVSHDLMDPGVNSEHVAQGISMAMCSVLGNLRGMTRMIDKPDSIAKVAFHLANREHEISNLVLNALEEVGKEDVITIMDGKHLFDELEVVVGLKLKEGYITPNFVTNQKTKQCELNNPLVLVCQKNLCSFEAKKVCDIVWQVKRDLLIVTEEIEADALSILVRNKLYSIIKVCVVKVPGSGQTDELNLKSVATFTGAEILRDMKTINPPMLGNCKMVTVSKDDCVILDGTGDISNTEIRAEKLADTIGEACFKEMIQERISKLLCHVVVVKIGGASKAEVGMKKAKLTAALAATKSALTAGVLPGNGFALLYGSKYLDKLETQNPGQKIGVHIIQNALRLPVHTTVSNAGLDATLTVEMLLKQDNMFHGYDASEGQFVDMMEAGLIEPYELLVKDLVAAQFESSTMFIT